MEERRYRQVLERQFYKLVIRESWGSDSLPPQAKPLHTPLAGIVLSYTETKRCTTQEECKKRVKEIHKQSIEKGMPHTHFNFLVGGDGYVYEAMGWHHFLPEHTEKIKGGEKLFGRSLEVAFIDKHSNEPTDPMQRGLSKIITMGLTEQLLVEDFAFYCRSDDGIEYLETRDKVKEKKRYMEEKRRERRDPNYRKKPRERVWIDKEEIHREIQKRFTKSPDQQVQIL